VDISNYALEAAKILGATHTVNPLQGDAKRAIYEILPEGPDLVVEAAGPILAVNLMVSLLRRGTRWNIFGITTHEKFELDGGWMHFLEARMDSSFSTNPLAMENAIRLMARDLVNPEKVISHRFPLSQIQKAIETMGSPQRNKVIVNP
jgi:threonine dehydrogenase-like Zn-dependent dehydrogenase